MIQILQISQVSFSSIQMMAIHRKKIAKYDLLRNSSLVLDEKRGKDLGGLFRSFCVNAFNGKNLFFLHDISKLQERF